MNIDYFKKLIYGENMSTVIAFHCIPWEVDASIERFWSALRIHLKRNGQELLLITTTSIKDSELLNIKIPYLLMDFNYEESVDNFLSESHPMVQILQDWYDLSREQSILLNSNVNAYIFRLMDTIRPSVVISWQSAHPLSRMVREICIKYDIQWWSAERGWIKNTLMLDMCENNILSEVNRSLVINRSIERYEPSEIMLRELEDRFNGEYSSARYINDSENLEFSSGKSLREKLNLSDQTPIWALFTHGEPHIHALSSALKFAHNSDSEKMQQKFCFLAKFLQKLGAVIIVREHPFNKQNGRSLVLDGLSNVYSHSGDLDELIAEADVGLFTLSTLQFDWAMKSKPFGVLCKSLLSGTSLAPQYDDYDSPESFVDACLNSAQWLERNKQIKKRIAYFYEFQLLDLKDFAFDESAKYLSNFIVNICGHKLEF
jgi:hypothetical protein